MNSGVVNPEPASRERRFSVSKVRHWASVGLNAVASWLDGSAWRGVLIIVLAYVPLALLMAHAQGLNADELYTWKIAQQPTIGDMIRLSRKIDLHPPLHFLLQREALKLGLPRWLGSRLPSLIAGMLSELAVFAFFATVFGRRKSSNLMGLLAASLYWFGPANDYGWLNRPYALWVCTLALSSLFWGLAIGERRRWWMPLALGLSALAMTLDYMFGLPCLLPFFLAEGVRLYKRRRIDWAVAIALIVPAIVGLTYLHQVNTFATNVFPDAYLPSFGLGVSIYNEMFGLAIYTVFACAFGARMFDAEPTSPEVREPLGGELWTLIGGLVAMPALLLIAGAIHHTQFFSRYAVCGTIGMAFLLAALIMRFNDRARIITVLVVVSLVSAAIGRITGDPDDPMGLRASVNVIGVPPGQIADLDPSLPIVVASAVDFTVLNDREPAAIADRLYYVTDRQAGIDFSGQTVFATEDETAPLLGLRGHAMPMKAFLQEHQHFYVVGDFLSTEEWFIRYLMHDGDSLLWLGRFVMPVASNQMYEVRMKDTPVAAAK